MSTYDRIIDKLEHFIRRYYQNELLKGGLLFFAIGLLYFLMTVAFEWFFWLGKTGRWVLFWLFISVELVLFARFILFPMAKLIKLSKGISYEEAARMIGTHFSEVHDKLLNILQLKRVGEEQNSELLMASIDQKAEELQPIPFHIAINFKSNLKYLKYTLIPLVVLGGILVSGKIKLFSESYHRVVNYQEAYEPPAPFSFYIMNQQLDMRDNEHFELQVKTEGKLIPEQVRIHYKGESYILKNESPGHFTYRFEDLDKDTDFYLSANEVQSRTYALRVINVPKINELAMTLTYPKYLNKASKTSKGSGNITIPEGTKVNWDIHTNHTDQLRIVMPDTSLNFTKNKNHFRQDFTFHKSLGYDLFIGNEFITDYEKLSYQVEVIKDQYPEIDVQMKRDSLSEEAMFFHGQVSDDYGLSHLQLVYYAEDNPQEMHRKAIELQPGNFDEFLYAFPDTLRLEKGKSYALYFQVFDNDGVNGAKSVQSETFQYKELSDHEREEKQLSKQKESIQGMDQSLEKMKSGEKDFEEINRLQKEKNSLNYNDRKRVEEYMKRLQDENKLMKDYTEKMSRDLEDFQKDKQQDSKKEQLKERVEENEKRLEKQEKLLEELEKYRDKLSKEDFSKRLEKINQEKKSQSRNLEQLLELTKRYYVQKRAERLSEELNKLADQQEELSRNEANNTKEAQDQLNEKFKKLRKDLEELQKENLGLRKPMDLGRDEPKERQVEHDQQEASEQLEEAAQEEKQREQNEDNSRNESKQQAQKKQQAAAEKMRQLGSSMQGQMQSSDQEQLEEDIEALRQILDNLLRFSFEQEDLMIDFQKLEKDSPDLGNKLKYQQQLKENFRHVDDSLYALALRNPMIGEKITDKLMGVQYNLDGALMTLAKFNISKGSASQQYVLTGANDLANLLDDALQQMEMSMEAEGSGGGEGMPQPGEGDGEGKFQLPDIIQGQEELNQQMQEGMQEGEEKGSEGEEGEQGDAGQEGQNGQEGNSEGEGSQEGGDGDAGSQYGEGNQPSEEMNSGQLFEIYKQQQKLRIELEELMRREHLGPEGMRLRQEMEQTEEELLESGLSRKSLEMMLQMKERMIRLQEASYRQEEEDKREATTNFKTYKNTSKENLEKAKDYFQSLEILNRQSLPLQPDYKQLVQDYFKDADD